jgi:tol-pal system protein YbgF
MKTFCLPLLVAVLFAGGCSWFQPSPEDQALEARKQEVEQASLQWRLKSLEENFLNFKEASRERESAFQEQSQRLTRRMEELSESIRKLKVRVAELSALAEAPVLVEETEPPPAEEDVVVGGSHSPEKRPWADVPGPQEEKPSPKKKPKPEPKPAPAGQAQYKKALSLLQNGKPDQARSAFNGFMEDHPDSSLVPNAMYWLGETYYSQKDYAQAILSFKDVPRRFPDHPKAAAAVLKTAMSYQKLGDKNNAVFYYRALLDDYPDSRPAELARSKLAELTQ